VTIGDWQKAVDRANQSRIRHRWVEDATSMPTYLVHKCEKCGAMRIRNATGYRWRFTGELWSRRCPPCRRPGGVA